MTHKCPGLPPHTFNGQYCRPCYTIQDWYANREYAQLEAVRNQNQRTLLVAISHYFVALALYTYALLKGQV